MNLVQWGSHPRQRVWKKALDPANKHWLVVIHGGAWKDERITHKSAAVALRSIERYQLLSQVPLKYGGLASVDYRLSPEVSDPEHLQDILRGIETIEANQVTLIGHSAGAFLAGQVASVRPRLVAGIVGIEGIYNLNLLVKEYPEYLEGFITAAFGKDESKWPQLNWSSLPLKVVVHSLEDELISFNQPNFVLNQTQAQLVKLNEGKHDYVYEVRDDWVIQTMQLLNC